jgi:glycosyltransferase involved in cell wall biosynthesis
LRLLFISTAYPGRLGALARGLAALKGYECRFLCRQALPDEPTDGLELEPFHDDVEPGRDSHHVTRFFEGQVKTAEAVCEAMRDLGWVPDVVVNQSCDGSALLARHVFPDCRIVTRFGALQRPRMAELGFRSHGVPAEDELLEGTARNAVPLIELHQCDAAFVPSMHLHGLLPAEFSYKAQLLFEGCDTDLYRPVPRAEARVFGEILSGRVQLVTFVSARLDPDHGMPSFLNAARLIHRRRPDVRFAICGHEVIHRGRPRLRQRMERSGLPMDRFLFSEPRARAEMAGLYSRSDVLVHLAVPGQGPERLIEALSCGALVLGSDTAPVREFIRHRQNGLLAGYYDPSALADEAIRVLECPEEFAAMRKNARSCVERYLSSAVGLKKFRHLLDGLGENLPQQFTSELVSPEAGES